MDLNQITVEASDFQASLAFYKAIGLRLIVLVDGAYARFELPSGSSTLSLHHTDQPVIGNTVLYFEVDDVDRQYEDLKARGIVFDTAPADQKWRWREVRLRDPAGNRLCIMHAGLDRRFPPWRLQAE